MHIVKSFLGMVVAALALATASCISNSHQPVTKQAGSAQQAKIPITRLADLPPHVYAIPQKPSQLVENKAAILELAKAVETDIKADMDKYDIQDQTAVRRFYGTLGVIAMLKSDYTSAHGYCEL